jgi:DNA-nicking Smr family endonuclease
MSRKPTPPPPDDTDAALFRSAIGKVRRIEAVAPVTPPRPAAEPRQRAADEEAALRQMRETPFAVEAADSLLYRRPEVAPRVLKRLRRGLYVVQDELDLHRMTATEAERSLRRFLAEAQAAGLSCVRVVHGKGLHAEDGGPVLKPLVEPLPSQRRDVLAYASAPPSGGGGGALLVLLARRQPGLNPD